MKYRIVPQIKKVQGEEVEVPVKDVRFFPIEKDGQKVGFGVLKYPIVQVLVQHEKADEPLKVKWMSGSGKFVIQQPDTQDYPVFYVGEGKRRRAVKDTLAPMKRIPGVKEEFTNSEAFGRAAVERFGNVFAGLVIGLIAEEIGNLCGAA